MRHSRRVAISILAAVILLASGASRARAGQVLALHQGATDPTTEGFTAGPRVGSWAVGPLANDLGLPAWKITSLSLSSQYAYVAPGLTSPQLAEIASQGFTLTMVARVLQNGLAPAYTSSDPVTIAAALVSYAGVRWEIDLGMNSNGDMVAVLPTTVDIGGPGDSYRSFGQSYTLTGSGSTYHDYQLLYNPSTDSASLYIDGVLRLSNYTGETNFYYDTALAWAGLSGGQGNFNLVQVQTGLASVPEPSSVVLMCTGALGLLGYASARRWREAVAS